MRGRRPARYVQGVYKGNFFRVKVPEETTLFPKLPRFPAALPVPKAMKGFLLDPSKLSMESIISGLVPQEKSFGRQIWDWTAENWPTMLLNFGSVCTLVAFTRSDVLELRTLSATGSISNVIYWMTQKPFLWVPVTWSSMFASVNGYKIMEILHERNADVRMSEEQEHIFVDHFMQHGVTPKQFERIEKAAKVLRFTKGQALISKGETLNHVYLVVQGSTQAHIKGRHLTAQSTSRKTKGVSKLGGDSGAWVGEMRFLDLYWQQQQKANPKRNEKDNTGTINEIEKSQTGKNRDVVIEAPKQVLYSVLAKEDCVVWAWSYEEMTNLVSSSTDIRGALTRAMTSAIVGKVVNMTVSRTNAMPNWSTWLSDWSREDGAKVDVRGVDPLAADQKIAEEETSDDSDYEPNPILQ